MKRLRRGTTPPSSFVTAMVSMFGLRSEAWRLLDVQSMLLLRRVCRTLRDALQRWVVLATADISLGAEAFGVPVELTTTDAASQLCELTRLLNFTYLVAVRCPLLGDQHRLSPELRKKQEHDERCRRVLRGRRVQVVVTKSQSKGWAVCAAEAIEQGAYVGEYTGELLSSREVRRRYEVRYDREALNYVLTLREHVAQRDTTGLQFDCVRTNVDASVSGNFTRFINHSCEANLEVVAVRVVSFVPQLALFARRHIERGEELSFDYGAGSTNTADILQSVDKTQAAASGRHRCRCGSAQCRGFLPSDC